MCSGYDANAADDQTITVSYGGQTARLTIAARHNWDNGPESSRAEKRQLSAEAKSCVQLCLPAEGAAP